MSVIPNQSKTAGTTGPVAMPARLAWWREARLGMFVHWGLSSLWGQELSWSRKSSNPRCPPVGSIPTADYDAGAMRLAATKFEAAAWAGAAKRMGAKYLVLTAKHHDGFCLWDTKTIPHKTTASPMGRDVVRELSVACREAGVRFCVYFSPADWKDPDCRHPEHNRRFVDRMHAQLTELMTGYGEMPLVWIDFDGFPNPSEPRETAELLRGLNPNVILTNRLEPLHSDESHGRIGPWGDYATPEQFVGSYCDQVPWETCMTLGRQWGWKPDDTLKGPAECVRTLMSTLGGDGNLLLNLAPNADGEIESRQTEITDAMGTWVARHSRAVYGTRGGPWTPTRFYASTRTKDAIHLTVFPAAGGIVRLPPIALRVLSAKLIDGSPADVKQTDGGVVVTVATDKLDPLATLVELRVDGDPLTIAATYPGSETGSLTYRRPARVSSTITPEFQHDAQAAIDDEFASCWIVGRDEGVSESVAGHRFEHFQHTPSADIWQHAGWLEVDLGTEKTVRRVVLGERVYPAMNVPVTNWAIEVQQGDRWVDIARGTSIGKCHELTLDEPARGRVFRLRIEAQGRFAITEFRLFEHVPTPAPRSAVEAWKDLRFGMFIHWGPVSLKGTEIGWSRGKEVPVAEYDALYKRFSAEKFDADAWVAVAKAAGMKYVVLTTKHHDGFCLWDTAQTPYNVINSPLGRDAVKELAEACRRAGLKFGPYYSTCDWHHPLFPLGSPGGSTVKPHHDLDGYQRYLEAQTAELVTKYGPLLTLWFDVPQEFSARRGQEVIEKLRKLQPDLVINNRTGAPGDFDTPEQYVGAYQDHRPWESCITIGDQWAWKPNENLKSLDRCLHTLLRCVGGDGNLLFNVGPTPEGLIEPDQIDRLKEMGAWLQKHGDSVYATRGGPWKPSATIASTRRANIIYVHVMRWPEDGVVRLPALPAKVVRSEVLGGGTASVEVTAEDWLLSVPPASRDAVSTVVVLELDVSAMAIPAVALPSSTPKATSSNVYHGQWLEYGPHKAVDGDHHTRWATDDYVTDAWLELEFDRPITASSIAVREYADRVKRFELQYRDGDTWKVAHAGTTLGHAFRAEFSPVRSKHFKLVILESTGGPSIHDLTLEDLRK